MQVSENPATYAHSTMLAIEGAVRALIVTKSERLVVVQQRWRRLQKTLKLLGLTSSSCVPCFEKFIKFSPHKNPLCNDVEVIKCV